MDVLWAPWRSEYIETFKDEAKKKKEDCFFCEAIERPEEDVKRFVVARREHTIVILNKFPYNNGHTLVAPLRHIGEQDELSDEEYIELMLLLRQTKKVLEEIYHPHGFNVGANLGRTAGAGVPGHMHYHIVPRWNGDSSFMTVFAGINVVSEAMHKTRDMMEKIFTEKYPVVE